MSSAQVSKSSPDPSIPFSILDLKAQAVRLPVSKGAQILLSELLTWSGEKGYCWWSVPKIAKDLRWSSSAVWRRATELKRAGLLEVIPRPGRSNFWVPLPGKAKMERLRSELTPLATPRGPSYEKKTENLKRCTVKGHCGSTDLPSLPPSPNVNALKICSNEMSPIPKTGMNTSEASIQDLNPILQRLSDQPIQHESESSTLPPKFKTTVPITSDHLLLVEEIERVTGDTWSRGHFVNLVRQTDEQTVYAALSVTKEKMTTESGVNPGAYLTATLKGMIGLSSLGGKCPNHVVHRQPCPDYPPTTAPSRPLRWISHPDEPKPEPIDPESMKKGWRIHYRGSGLPSMLSLVQRCVPLSVDVTGLWRDVRETFSGMEESVLIDRLLDTVVTRVRHAEKMGAGGDCLTDMFIRNGETS